MKEFQAIFFDRDGTLTFDDPDIERERQRRYQEMAGKKLDLHYDRFMKIFHQVRQQNKPYVPYKYPGG